jgi:hypothetical protein
VIDLLTRERGRLEALARALLERETLDQPEAYERAGFDLPTLDTAETNAHTRPAIPVDEGSVPG